MKRIRWDWRLLKLIAMSRGFLLKEIPGQLPEKKFKNRKGLAESTLHGKAKKGKPAPRRVAEYLVSDEGLPTRKGFEKTAKVIRLGLAELDALSVKLDTQGGKLDTVDDKLDKANALLADISARQKSGRHLNGTVLGILLLAGLFVGRLIQADTRHAKAATSAFVLRTAVAGVLGLGKKAEEYWIPDAPFPWQKLAKDCDASAGERAINGGCWIPIKDIDPPCGKLIRHGDTCYRAVAADPTKPVGLVRTVPGLP